MANRTPVGGQPRPPQRTLSASSLSMPRPPTQRSLSQHYLPGSPARKDPSSAASSFVDITDDAATDPAFTANPNPNTPRRIGSKLRLELAPSPDARLTSQTEWSGTFSPLNPSTPSRHLPISETNTVVGHQSPAMSRSPQPDPDNPPMPMPKRRPRISVPSRPKAPSAPVTTTAKKDARPKPYVVEPPTDAPKCPPLRKLEKPPRDHFSKGLYSGLVDFYPWTGRHHEDEWTSDGIQKGVFDRGSPNESSSARVAIYTPLRQQKSGLNALSQLFMTVLNQRRSRGQINVPSTFKPPPRVTLTDTKREVWLKDLANPSMSLRRLSRTIPHGIKGMTLLEQCLNKNVPTERALWLAKCVGANELRAAKRKVPGSLVNGPEKWMNEWTGFIEQFLVSVTSSFGDPEWKTKFHYAIRLSTSFYYNRLMDTDHYLDWVVTSLEQSSQAKLPLYVLITKIYWTDLLKSRKCGRRLVQALLSHFQSISNEPDAEVLAPLTVSLAELLSDLLKRSPESFVNPRIWYQYRTMLKHVLVQHGDHELQQIYQKTDARNIRISSSNTSSAPGGKQQLVFILDRSLSDLAVENLAEQCWATLDDKHQVVKTTVQWATSLHRPSAAKIYIAARLVRSWDMQDPSPTMAILETLDMVDAHDTARKDLFYRFIGELVRSGHFSIPTYMHWLIARGGYHEAADIDQEQASCGTRLLMELPTYCMADKWKSERANLLRRAGGYSVADEESDIKNALKFITRLAGLPGDPNDPYFQKKAGSLPKLLVRLADSSHSLQSAVGAYLRDVIANLASQSKEPFLLPTTTFTSIRTILEALEDFSMLSDILFACKRVSDVDLLGSCVDTINCNLQMFLALGTANDLMECYIDRLKSIHEEQSLTARPLLAALAHLAGRLPAQQIIASQLQNELLQVDRTNPIDACSPMSDNMVTQAATRETEVTEEIEKTFNSGNTIDQPTMNRLFRTMIPRLEKGWKAEDDNRRVFASFLARLRTYDTKHFDRLMSDWISHVRMTKNRHSLAGLVPLLISLGCLSVSTLLHTALPLPAGQAGAVDGIVSSPASYLQELLQLMITKLSATTVLTPEEEYRFRIHQQSAQFENSKGLLSLTRHAIVEWSTLKGSVDGQQPLDDERCQKRVLELLRFLAVADYNAVATALSAKNLSAEATQQVCQITNRLLVPSDNTGSRATFDDILGLADELTLPFCQLKLNLDLSLEQPQQQQPTPVTDGEPTRFDLFAKAMDRAIEADNITWTRMLPCLSNDITLHLKNQAYERFLSMLPSVKSPTVNDDAHSSEKIRMAENLLGVLEVIIAGAPPPNTAQLTHMMVDKLTDVWEFLSSTDQDLKGAQEVVRDRWLPTLLKFITLHSTSASEAMPAPSNSGPAGKTIAQPPANRDPRSRIILSLCAILLELEASQPPSAGPSITQHVFDTALLLVDALPDEHRLQCARLILFTPGATASPHLSSDARLYYLFSFPSATTELDGMVLGKRSMTSTPHSSTARLFGNLYGCGPAVMDKFTPFVAKRWELLSEPTPNVGENDTSLSLALFESIKI